MIIFSLYLDSFSKGEFLGTPPTFESDNAVRPHGRHDVLNQGQHYRLFSSLLTTKTMLKFCITGYPRISLPKCVKRFRVMTCVRLPTGVNPILMSNWYLWSTFLIMYIRVRRQHVGLQSDSSCIWNRLIHSRFQRVHLCFIRSKKNNN